MKHFAVLIALLRDRKTFLEEIRHNTRVESKIISLLIASSTFLAVYGAIIGSSSTLLQVISSAIKLPALYLITLTICLPALFFFDILFGSSLSFSQYTALSLTTVSVISVLLFSFAPIALFFLISVHDYNFFLLLNVGIFTMTGFIGIRVFYEGMRSLSRSRALIEKPAPALPSSDDFLPIADVPSAKDATQSSTAIGLSKEDSLQKTRLRLLQFWLLLYGLVGSQLGWTLRPFFGAPGEPFQFFRTIESNFYAQVWRLFLTFLGFN
ncbi:actin-binding WH2 domain-containing protein [Phormidium tenue FACHB-886]|nr:actin-binding WH2 domain-containing protein [Phormidium tenue FACHB-886]